MVLSDQVPDDAWLPRLPELGTLNKAGMSQILAPVVSIPATRIGLYILFSLQDTGCAREQGIHLLTFKSNHLIFTGADSLTNEGALS